MAKEKRLKEFAVIRLQGRSDKLEPELVPVTVNGERIRLKRSEFVPVKAGVVEALRNAKRPMAENGAEGAGGTTIRKKKIAGFIQRFPMEIVGWVNKDQYEYLRDIAKVRSITEVECYGVIDGDIDVTVEVAA